MENLLGGAVVGNRPIAGFAWWQMAAAKEASLRGPGWFWIGLMRGQSEWKGMEVLANPEWKCLYV